ncbi:receptor-interacting serine/threonine-protein kinase 4, partial [Ixodes scapularis]|uniref:receptor-interacting serine/threonine-protein kinase 4 n=1 Tax=Ixodes scapularis TaxID=6945 RepID=UPI001C38E561
IALQPSVYCLRRRLLRHHSSQTEEEPCTETDSTLGSGGSPLQRYPRHGESCLTGDHTDPDPEASSAAPSDLAHSRDVRTSDLDSSVVSSSSTSVRWTTAYPTSDFRRTLHYDSHPQEARETDPDTELVTSEQISSTDAEDTRSVGTEDVSEVTTASESRIDDDKAHVHYEPDVAAGTSQASAEACVEATAEGETKAGAQADPDTSTRSQGDAEGDQSSEAGPSSAPMFLRPTIEIDTSDILHKAKPEIDEGDFGVGPSYKKMTEAEFVAQLSIHEAARTGDLHVIKLLLKSDSKRMETVDERGWTPIHLAAANGQSEVVKYLALEGADVAALDPTSYTAMHLAAMNGHNSCLEVLLKVGADVDNITADGFTPLHLAALNNYADCVRTLLSWGANLAIEDALGRTVQDMVEEYALDDVSTLLSGLWTHIDKYRQNGQSGNSRKRSTRKLVQMAASSMGQD